MRENQRYIIFSKKLQSNLEEKNEFLKFFRLYLASKIEIVYFLWLLNLYFSIYTEITKRIIKIF